jgi:hypothetical protein
VGRERNGPLYLLLARIQYYRSVLRIVTLLVIGMLVIPPASAASLKELADTVKDIDALLLQLQNDPVDVEGLSVQFAEYANPELFPPSAGASSSRPGLAETFSGSFLTVQVGSQTMAFRDVPRDAWFAPYVRVAAEQGIVGGYQDAQGNLLGEYKPENPVSLEEVAKIAVVAAYVDVLSCPASKNVTASGSWSMGYVGCAESRGWGVFSDATADVKRPATRAEVVFTVLQALGAQGASTTGSGWTTGFHDVPASMPFAIAIARAKHDGIVNGYGDDDGVPTGFFGPADPVKRAEMAKIISLAIQVYQ